MRQFAGSDAGAVDANPSAFLRAEPFRTDEPFLAVHGRGDAVVPMYFSTRLDPTETVTDPTEPLEFGAAEAEAPPPQTLVLLHDIGHVGMLQLHGEAEARAYAHCSSHAQTRTRRGGLISCVPLPHSLTVHVC